ncbi:hypothetical protein I3760_04G019700 [Carya illinoinensis]|nr:hypothetical protein I3760_04G019700 [Carya illinoinensis]
MGSFLSRFIDGGTEVSRVSSFHSSDSWQLHFKNSEASSQLMVIDFTASWGGPCKLMKPVFKALSSTFKDVDFVKIDVGELPDVAEEFKVKAMPTFVLVKKGKEVDRVVGRWVGARKYELQEKIEEHRAQLLPST